MKKFAPYATPGGRVYRLYTHLADRHRTRSARAHIAALRSLLPGSNDCEV